MGSSLTSTPSSVDETGYNTIYPSSFFVAANDGEGAITGTTSGTGALTMTSLAIVSALVSVPESNSL